MVVGGTRGASGFFGAGATVGGGISLPLLLVFTGASGWGRWNWPLSGAPWPMFPTGEPPPPAALSLREGGATGRSMIMSPKPPAASRRSAAKAIAATASGDLPLNPDRVGI